MLLKKKKNIYIYKICVCFPYTILTRKARNKTVAKIIVIFFFFFYNCIFFLLKQTKLQKFKIAGIAVNLAQKLAETETVKSDFTVPYFCVFYCKREIVSIHAIILNLCCSLARHFRDKLRAPI